MFDIYETKKTFQTQAQWRLKGIFAPSNAIKLESLLLVLTKRSLQKSVLHFPFFPVTSFLCIKSKFFYE